MQLLFKAIKDEAGGGCGAGLAECAHGVLDSVLPVIWFVRRQMGQHRKGLSMPQFRTLCAVDSQPAMNLSHLADHLGASLPTASRIVGGLVTKGFLVRTGSAEDRRVLALALTPLGRDVLDRAWVAAHQSMEEKLEKLSGEERAVVSGAMGILRGVFGSAGLRETSGRRAGAAKKPAAVVKGR